MLEIEMTNPTPYQLGHLPPPEYDPDAAEPQAASARTDNEAILIRRVVAGEIDLFGELVGPHLPRVLAFARQQLGNNADAEDAVQEAMFKAFSHLADFRLEARFSTWLLRITCNEIHQVRRRHGRTARFVSSQTSDDPPPESLWRDPGPSPLELLEQKAVTQRLHASIQRLPKPLRAAMVLRGIEELSTDDIARRLNLTTSNVKTRLFRARLRLSGTWSARREAPTTRGARRRAAGKEL